MASYDIALALHALVPGARYRGSLTANNQAAYEAILWSADEIRPQPTWAEVHAKALELQGDEEQFNSIVNMPIEAIKQSQEGN
jgi:hypothetical protein